MRTRSNILISLGWKAVRSRAFRDSDEFLDEFISVLTSLGGVYAKFLQGVLLGFVVTRGKQMSSNQLNVFEDNPDPGFSAETLTQVLQSTHGRVAIQNTTPIGVGSYSAVYCALLDGEHPVVVKVLRPHIHQEIAHDLKFLRKLTYIFKFAGIKFVAMDISQFFSSFKKACLKETDFPAETEFAHEMYLRYKDHPHIIVPRTYTELCSDEIIVQERIGGISVKSLVEARLKENADVFSITEEHFSTDLIYTMRVLSYEMFYSFLSNKPFHGDLHPGNVRILENNKVAILDFGIKAEPYHSSVVPAAVNKLLSDAKFLNGDFDPVRLLDAHFRLYMAKLYESIDSLLTYHKRDVADFFKVLVSTLSISTSDATDEKKEKWLMVGPAAMLNELMSGSDKFGIEVKVRDHATQRAIATQYSLLKALGMVGGRGLGPMYEKLCPRIKEEQPELFGPKKMILPDLALENVYSWIERLVTANPDLAKKLRKAMKDVADDSAVQRS